MPNAALHTTYGYCSSQSSTPLNDNQPDTKKSRSAQILNALNNTEVQPLLTNTQIIIKELHQTQKTLPNLLQWEATTAQDKKKVEEQDQLVLEKIAKQIQFSIQTMLQIKQPNHKKKETQEKRIQEERALNQQIWNYFIPKKQPTINSQEILHQVFWRTLPPTRSTHYIDIEED